MKTYNPNRVGRTRVSLKTSASGCVIRWYRFDGACIGEIRRNSRVEALAAWKHF